MNKSGDLMYNTVIRVNNSVKYLKVANRIDCKYSDHTPKRLLCEVTEVLTNCTVVVISQYIHVSGHHVCIP